jgi:hypothetical protein
MAIPAHEWDRVYNEFWWKPESSEDSEKEEQKIREEKTAQKRKDMYTYAVLLFVLLFVLVSTLKCCTMPPAITTDQRDNVRRPLFGTDGVPMFRNASSHKMPLPQSFVRPAAAARPKSVIPAARAKSVIPAARPKSVIPAARAKSVIPAARAKSVIPYAKPVIPAARAKPVIPAARPKPVIPAATPTPEENEPEPNATMYNSMFAYLVGGPITVVTVTALFVPTTVFESIPFLFPDCVVYATLNVLYYPYEAFLFVSSFYGIHRNYRA